MNLKSEKLEIVKTVVGMKVVIVQLYQLLALLAEHNRSLEEDLAWAQSDYEDLSQQMRIVKDRAHTYSVILAERQGESNGE